MTTTLATPSAGRDNAPPTEPPADLQPSDPLPLLRGFAGLRRLTGMYPPGHPTITQKLREVDDIVQQHLQLAPALRIDIIRGDVHLDGVAYRPDGQRTEQIVNELVDLGVHSIDRKSVV
jgi:hypothetical protein